MKTYSTTELSEAAGTTIRTIRFWEMNNLFGTVGRDGRGDRAFTEEQRGFARVIQAASMIGLGIKEIAELRRKWQSNVTREEFRAKLVSARDYLTAVETEIYREELDL